jgi:hypothetical protein
MRKALAVLIIFSGFACDNKLSDEQRKAMRENMELHKIRKISDAEITEAAYTEGRRILANLEQAANDSTKLNATISSYNGKVRLIRPGKDNAMDIEQQLVDAYLADESGGVQDNIQKIKRDNVDTDSILYTKPALVKMPDGSERLEGIWSIWLSKKEIIIKMK